jgi:hypothetical protein
VNRMPSSASAPQPEQVAAFFQKHRTGLVTLAAVGWTYLSKPRSVPPRDWLVVLSEPVLGWQRNATEALAPTVAIQTSNCGPREISISASG